MMKNDPLHFSKQTPTPWMIDRARIVWQDRRWGYQGRFYCHLVTSLQLWRRGGGGTSVGYIDISISQLETVSSISRGPSRTTLDTISIPSLPQELYSVREKLQISQMSSKLSVDNAIVLILASTCTKDAKIYRFLTPTFNHSGTQSV